MRRPAQPCLGALPSRGWRIVFAAVCFACAACQSPLSDEALRGENGNPLQSDSDPAKLMTHDPGNRRAIHARCACLSESFAKAATLGAAHGAQNRLGNLGMPKNARQTSEGYWVGSQPSPKEIDELYARNIRLVITAAAMDSETLRAVRGKLRSYGMKHINIPFGGRFPNPKSFYGTVRSYRPDQIYIHCEHGGDRSGALLAYLLIIDHGWTIPRAFLAVAFPGKSDSGKLIDILQNRGFQIEQPDIDAYLGIYSAETNGGYGGLKVRSPGYVKLINTTIDAALRALNH